MNINLKWLKDTIEEMRGIYHFADEDASIVINGGFPYPDSYMVIVRITDKETGIDISLEKGILLSDGEDKSRFKISRKIKKARCENRFD